MPPPQTGAKALNAFAVPPQFVCLVNQANLFDILYADQRLRLVLLVHRNGSEASSSSVPTGSHQPPALCKARNNYYSSSLPLKLCLTA